MAAFRVCAEALSSTPFDAQALHAYAAAALEVDKPDEFSRAYETLVGIEGVSGRSQDLVARYYFRQGQFEQSATAGLNAIVLGGASPEAILCLAISLLRIGRTALDPAGRKIEPTSLLLDVRMLQPDLGPVCDYHLADAIGRSVESLDRLTQEDVGRAIRAGIHPPGAYDAAINNLAIRDGEFADVLRRFDEAYRREESFPEVGMTEMLALSRQLGLMEKLKVELNCLPHIEGLLAGCRRYLLRQLVDRTFSPVGENLLDCIARQMVLSEHVLDITDEERRLLDDVLDEVRQRGSLLPQEFLLLASYLPFEMLADWPLRGREAYAEALYRELSEQLNSYRRAMPGKRKSDQPESQIQEFYEATPYPRWCHLPTEGIRRSKGPFTSIFSQLFPGVALPRRSFAEGPVRVLVAGCGTGQAIQRSLFLANARITAIDISRTSLAYARFRLEHLGFRDIDYRHCDIANATGLGRRFDMIDCTGVLHHMDDPWMGLEHLAAVLDPGGVMLLAVYSKEFREMLKPAMDVARAIFDRVEGDLPARLRQTRREMLRRRSSIDDFDKILPTLVDFFSLSAFRDLLLNPVEHPMTVDEFIEGCESRGLRLLGFKITGAEMEEAAARMPRRGDIYAELEYWKAEERNNPMVFKSMIAAVFERSA